MFSSLRSSLAPASAASHAPERPIVTTLWFGHESVWMRRIARIVLATWLLPLLFAFLTVGSLSAPAHAQSSAQSVVVLDFSVSPGIDPLLGRKAADGLAVELQRSQEYEIVPRQRFEEAVAQQAGLRPPFNDTSQIRLAQTLQASSVFSGRVVAVNVQPGRSATVTIEVRQLDAQTGDYINGTQVVEPAEQRLQPIANEILVDEAINKATFSAVRSMRQTSLPQGKVLGTTVDDYELSIGARNGVGLGQRYSVLRDIPNRGRGNVVERVKIAEITITRVEDDQAVGHLSAGGAQGVTTGDFIRQIFVPGYYPVSTASINGGSVTPVTAAPSLRRNSTSFTKGAVGKGVFGLIGLAALIGLAGAGGGGGGSLGSPSVSDIREGRPVDKFYPQPSLQIRADFPGINLSSDLRAESVIGYLVFRGTTPDFTTSPQNLQDYVDGRNLGRGSTTGYTDRGGGTFTVSIVVQTTTADTGTCAAGLTSCVEFNRTEQPLKIAANPFIDFESTNFELFFTPQPLQIGQTYFYKVQRITAERVRSSSGATTGGTTTAGSVGGTSVTIFPIASNTSKASGAYTPLFRPEIESNINGFNLSNFSVELSFDFTTFFSGSQSLDFSTDGTPYVGDGVDIFLIQISRTPNFEDSTTVTSPEIVNPAPNAPTASNITLPAQSFNIPPLVVGGQTQDYIAGQTQLYLRILVRNNNDAEKRQAFLRRSLPFPFIETVGTATTVATSQTGSRFLSTRKRGSLSLNRTGGGVRTLGVGSPGGPRVLKPR